MSDMGPDRHAQPASDFKPSFGTPAFWFWPTAGRHLQGRFVWVRIILATLSGILLATAFAPLDIFIAPFLAVPLFILLIDQAPTARQAFKDGWWVGLGFFAVGLSWIGHSFTQQDNVPVELAPFATAALAAGMALYTGLAFWLCRRLWLTGWLRLPLFAAIWTLFEFARGFWFSGFPWNLVGAIWANWLPVAQGASLVSVYGMTFLTMLAAGALAVFIGEKPRTLAILYAVLAVLLMPALGVWGKLRLDENQTAYQLGVSLRLVQANVKQREKWISHLIDDHFDKHLDLSRGRSDRGKAEGIKLLIWPEAAVQREDFDREGSLLRWRMSQLLDFGSYAVTGVPRYERTPGGVEYFNSLVALNSRGQLAARYDKVHLVPFGEYVPLKDVFSMLGISQLASGAAFTAGKTRTLMQLPGVPPFMPLICYEVIFPGQTPLGPERPEWLLNVTNDGWFGVTNGPYQHLALARFRAIEEGLPVVRSAGTGISAVIDAYGRTVSSLGLDRQGVVDSPLPVAAEPPDYSTTFKMLGVFGVCSFIFLLALIAGVRRHRVS